MKKEDERQSRIHAESGRNAFFISIALIGALNAYRTYVSGELDSKLMAVFLGVLITYVASVLYYRNRGLENGLSLSNLRSK